MRTTKFLIVFLLTVLGCVSGFAEQRRVVVLPPQFAGQKAVAVGSDEYQKLLGKNAEISQAIIDGDKDFLEFRKKTDGTIAAKDAEIKQAVAQRDSLAAARGFWRKLFGGSLFLTILFGGGLVALFIFNPALAMSVIRIFLTCVKFVAKLFGIALARLESALSHLKDYKAPIVEKKDTPPTL